MSLDMTPTYNLKVVVQETGVKPDTLRAWERRYGLPCPQRTTGRHRLYSQHDIETIKWLVARQEEGLSISHSVELWENLIETGKNPLVEYQSHTPTASTAAISPGSTVADIRHAWLEACIDFNETAAEQILTQAFALYPPVMVCLEVLQKGLAQMGEWWYSNEITVQQEHFASALAMRRLNALVAAAPQPTRSGRMIVACPAQEDHVFAPLLLTLMLRYNGWEVIYLGANVPLARLEVMLQAVQPDLVIMTAQQLHSAANLKQVAEFLHKQQVAMAFGGHIFNYTPQIRKRIPGYFLGERLEDTVRGVSNILTHKPTVPHTEAVSPAYRQALQHYRQQQAAIENHVWQILREQNAVYEHITNANLYLSRDIIAALQLGDMTLLGTEIHWTEKLLLNYSMPPVVLHHYLEAYYQAAKAHLGPEGRPVLGWLEGVRATS
ncbi:MAG: MerR family transcriptional regulator [Anaerolineales bacterium]|nr:MerR family transcriptional regulator [Anaerolineales bacterium]